MDFDQILKEVVWRLVTEGRISYRRIKLRFALDDDGLEELRHELIALKRLAVDVDGELLAWVPDGRAAGPEPWRCRDHCRPSRLPWHRMRSAAS